MRRLIHEAQTALGPITEMDGRVLYSSIETLKPGWLYLMGLNPGEGPDRYHHVGQSLLDMPNHCSNTYIDDDWGRGIGGHHTQQRVRFMLAALGVETRDIFATNLVFARSRTWTATEARLVPACLRVHGMFFEIVRPRVILTFGKDAFNAWIGMQRHGPITCFDTCVPNGRANYRCYASDTDLFGRPVRIVCVPHLSKFKLDAQPATVHWLQRAVGV